jgi:SM-20-related protein
MNISISSNASCHIEQRDYMNEQFERLITGYMDNQLGIASDFLTDELAIALQKNLIQLAQDDQLHQAGVGSAARLSFKPKIRKDRIFWLDNKKNGPFELAFFARIEEFIQYLNETCYAGITDYEFHYALYESGCFYKRHKDQFKDDNKRQFTLITYLNDNWQPGDGGELVVYKNKDPKDSIASKREEIITPTIGKTVFFKSNELEHEVLHANTNRMSITGWLKKG